MNIRQQFEEWVKKTTNENLPNDFDRFPVDHRRHGQYKNSIVNALWSQWKDRKAQDEARKESAPKPTMKLAWRRVDPSNLNAVFSLNSTNPQWYALHQWHEDDSGNGEWKEVEVEK